MKTVVTILSLILVGCGKDGDEQLPPAPVESLNLYPELNPDNIIIGFGEVPEGYAGQCIETKSQNFIVINKDIWEKALNETRRKALIMHELGHCVYGLQHDARVDNQGHMVSIMYPGSLSNQQAQYFDEHEQHYINAMLAQ